MAFKQATAEELRIVSAAMQAMRNELMEHAHTAAINNGFGEADIRFIAVCGTLIGAAQRYALSIHGSPGKYEIFRAMLASMAGDSRHNAMTRSMTDLGPEAFEGAPSILKPY